MYVQYRNPNQEDLAKLIGEIRGERSLARFADDIKRETPGIKVSASTLSRACNCGDNPVNYDLLEAIAKVAENPEVTLGQLLDANGTRSQEDDRQLAKKTAAEARRDELEGIRRMAELIIQDEISCREYSMRKLPGYFNGATLNGYIYQQDRMFPRNFDFGYSVSGMLPCSTWKFSVCPYRLPDTGVAASNYEAYIGNFINRVGSVFAGDSLESHLYVNEETGFVEKYSFVFISRKMYETFLNRIKNQEIIVNGLMTAILLNTETYSVEEETTLDRGDGEEASSFFAQPKTREKADVDIVAAFVDTEF